jgi:hypothetical protein
MIHDSKHMFFNTVGTEDGFNLSVETHVFISVWWNAH